MSEPNQKNYIRARISLYLAKASRPALYDEIQRLIDPEDAPNRRLRESLNRLQIERIFDLAEIGLRTLAAGGLPNPEPGGRAEVGKATQDRPETSPAPAHQDGANQAAEVSESPAPGLGPTGGIITISQSRGGAMSKFIR